MSTTLARMCGRGQVSMTVPRPGLEHLLNSASGPQLGQFVGELVRATRWGGARWLHSSKSTDRACGSTSTDRSASWGNLGLLGAPDEISAGWVTGARSALRNPTAASMSSSLSVCGSQVGGGGRWGGTGWLGAMSRRRKACCRRRGSSWRTRARSRRHRVSTGLQSSSPIVAGSKPATVWTARGLARAVASATVAPAENPNRW